MAWLNSFSWNYGWQVINLIMNKVLSNDLSGAILEGIDSQLYQTL
jgi:hypothetical protein